MLLKTKHVLVTFLLLTSTLFPLWPENIQCNFSPLKFVKYCIMIQQMVYFGNCPSTVEKNVYSAGVGDGVLYMSVQSSVLTMISIEIFVCLFY